MRPSTDLDAVQMPDRNSSESSSTMVRFPDEGRRRKDSRTSRFGKSSGNNGCLRPVVREPVHIEAAPERHGVCDGFCRRMELVAVAPPGDLRERAYVCCDSFHAAHYTIFSASAQQPQVRLRGCEGIRLNRNLRRFCAAHGSQGILPGILFLMCSSAAFARARIFSSRTPRSRISIVTASGRLPQLANARPRLSIV